MAHWQFVIWSLGGVVGIGTLLMCVALVVLALVGGLTTNKQVSGQCQQLVALLLLRKDAKDVLPSLAKSSREDAAPPTKEGSTGTDPVSPAIALNPVSSTAAAPANQQRPSPRRRRARSPGPQSGAAQPPVPKEAHRGR
jgi:hypothetical protein